MIKIWHGYYVGKDGLYDRDVMERPRGKLSKTLSRALTWEGVNTFVTRLRPRQLAGAAQ
jgi:hypothetical protein